MWENRPNENISDMKQGGKVRTIMYDAVNNNISQITEILFRTDIIAGGVIWPIAFVLFKWIMALGINRIVVPKYKEDVKNHYLWNYLVEFLKIMLVPIAFSCGIVYSALEILHPVWNNDVIVAMVLFLLGPVCVLVSRGSLKKKLPIILKTMIETVMCSILFLFLSTQFRANEQTNWFLAICVFIQLTCFECHLREDVENNQGNVFVKIIEYILSVMWYVCCSITLDKMIYIVFSLISMIVVFIDLWIRRNRNEPLIKKGIVVSGFGNADKEYITYDSIKKSFSGTLSFRDKDNCKITVSRNTIKQIAFDYPSKLRLSRKVENFKVLDDSTISLEGEWYIKAVMTDWLWICSWDGENTKNVIYPRNNVLWSVKECKRIKRGRRIC